MSRRTPDDLTRKFTRLVESLKAALDALEDNDIHGVHQILSTAIAAAEAGDG